MGVKLNPFTGKLDVVDSPSGDFSTVELNQGTQTSPSISFDGDPNTGIYSPGADQVAISTNGTGRLFVDASGRVGIESAPWNGAVGLYIGDAGHIYGVGTNSVYYNTNAYFNSGWKYNGNSAAVQLEASGGQFIFNTAPVNSLGAGAALTWSERLRITSTGQLSHIGGGSTGSPAVGFNGSAPSNSLVVDSTGAVGIGTSSPDALLTVSGVNNIHAHNASGDASIGLSTGGTPASPTQRYTLFVDDSDGDKFIINDSTAGERRLTIDTSGNVGVGTTSPSSPINTGKLMVQGGDIVVRDGNAGSSWNRGTLVFDIRNSNGDSKSAYIQSNGVSDVSSTLQFFTTATHNLSERMRVDDAGRLLVGTSSARANLFNSSITTALQVEGTTDNNSAILVTTNQAFPNGPRLDFAKSRGSTVGSNTLVNSGDNLGSINFQGSDGSQFVNSASIQANVDGTPGANDMPGRLVFSTTADGASSPTERMKINSSGNVGINTDPAYRFDVNGAGCFRDDFRVSRLNTANNGIFFTAGDTGAGNRPSIAIQGASSTGLGNIAFKVAYNNGGNTVLQIQYTGNVENINNSYGAISDAKLKENIVDASSQWNDIKDIRVRKYNFIEGQTHTQIGLIAQEVELVSPGLVSESPDRDEDGNDLGTVTKSVNYSVLYMKAVKALQEAMERIEQLEQRLTDAGL